MRVKGVQVSGLAGQTCPNTTISINTAFIKSQFVFLSMLIIFVKITYLDAKVEKKIVFLG